MRRLAVNRDVAMIERILICTDLDRTLLPNGNAPESPSARPLFAALAARPEVLVAYVSGRDKTLVQQAIADFGLPLPDYVVGDVGSSVYRLDGSSWQIFEAWENRIAVDWCGHDHASLHLLFADLPRLTLQEPGKQNRFKLSYYLNLDRDAAELLEIMQARIADCGVKAEVIYSLDEAEQVVLLDVLPSSATKYHAVEFLMEQLGIDPGQTVFAGDSGNDLPVLISRVQSVLVANAADAVKTQAQELARQNGTEAALYLAQGGFMGLNGNYAAGILEGVAHFLPHTQTWMQHYG